MGGRMNRVTYGCLGQSLRSYCLWVEGRTKPPISAFVQNLSPSTHGWKDEPSHSRVSWSKLKSCYLRVEGRTKPPASALVQNLSPSTYGWKDKGGTDRRGMYRSNSHVASSPLLCGLQGTLNGKYL